MFQLIVDKLAQCLPWYPSERVLCLGVEYDGSDEIGRKAFLEDFSSRIQLTYRSGFTTPLTLVGGKEINSDSGWGCMLRVTQMALAQCFVSLKFGREWRFDAARDLEPNSDYLQIVSCFLDTPSALLSLHNLVAAGQRLLGKAPSEWFGPTSAARAVCSLFSDARGDATLAMSPLIRHTGCVAFDDGTIFKESVLQQFAEGCESVILLFCRRLGLDNITIEHRSGLERCFSLPQFEGLASGNSGSSAHFFVATQGDTLLYLDPHITQPALESVDDVRGSAGSLRPSRPLPLRWSRLNPSVCLVFLVRSRSDFAQLCEKLSEEPFKEVFEILDRRPEYVERAVVAEGDFALLE